MSRATQVQAAIAALGEDPDVDLVKRTLAEFDVRDIAASLVSTQGAGGGSQPVSVTQVTLTDEQIKALPTARVELIAAPGLGKMIAPFAVWFVADATAALYTGTDEAKMFVGTLDDEFPMLAEISNAGNSAVATLLSNVTHPFSFAWMGLEQSGLGIQVGEGVGGTGGYTHAVSEGSYDADILENSPLVVGIYGTGGEDLAGGDAANTLTVTVLYAVVDFPT